MFFVQLYGLNEKMVLLVTRYEYVYWLVWTDTSLIETAVRNGVR